MKDVVEKYIAAGFSLVPTNKTKMPTTKAWKDVDIPLSEFNSHGIGIKCGKASNNLECIDFDNHFGDAKDVISDFMQIEGVKEIYQKYKLPIQSTVGGGFHLLYRCEVNEGNKKLARRPKVKDNGRTEPDVLIETRGEGGYFVVWPTPGYTVVKNDIFTVAQINPEERDILLSAARVFNTWVEHSYHTDQDKERPGDYYNNTPDAIEEMRAALLRAGWTDVNGGRWRRPSKKEGISATLGRAAPGIFYNFSSSAYPFDQEHGYTAFQVVGLLDYNGNFKQLALDIVERFQLNDKKIIAGNYGVVKKETTIDEIDEFIKKSFINLDIPVAKPPVIMRIKAYMGTSFGYSRVFTLGNFSAITGKSKSKKTYLATLLLTASVKNNYYDMVFEASLPSSRTGVLLFDTEQSNYDAYITAKRVYDLLGYSDERFGAFDLREFTPIERCKIIERTLEKMCNNISFVVIDGIADLAMAINDEIEASRVVSLLMKWTKKYNIHIVNIIHQNKNDEYATGHLGSAILKKSECIISVKKDISDTSQSEVKCDLIRGAGDFDDFTFRIDEFGLPRVIDNYASQVKLPPRI